MQINFNPSIKQQNFKALSDAQIANITKGMGQAEQFKTDVVRGAIKLDGADIQKLTELIPKLKEQGELFVAFILEKVVKPK